MKNKHLPLLLIILASLCFVFPATFVKLLINDISPIGSLTLRFFIASLGFPLFLVIFNKKKIRSILYSTKAELAHFALLSLLLSLSLALAFTAYYFIAANKATLIFLMYPIFDTILAWIFLKEKITTATIPPLLLTCLGAYFILGLDDGQGNIIGYTLATIGTLLFAAYLVMSRSVGEHYDYYKRTAWLFIYTFFFLFIVFFFTGGVETLFLISWKNWLILVLFGVISTLIPYVCLSYATAKMKSSLISVIINLGPMVGIALVTYMFNEPFTTNMWIGSVCILLAFVISTLVEWKDENKHWKHAHH